MSNQKRIEDVAALLYRSGKQCNPYGDADAIRACLAQTLATLPEFQSCAWVPCSERMPDVKPGVRTALRRAGKRTGATVQRADD